MYAIYDWIFTGLNEAQHMTINSQLMELQRRALYADRFADEGIMYDYLTKPKSTSNDKEVNEYIERLYFTYDKNWKAPERNATFSTDLTQKKWRGS
ncbi:MAG: hypothetical protein PG981_000329 [Wolbachia endosymbiont of Ctenocephalides orientis wCori]|nr:MAG: hypothetical protein PG981_000329 [Wolbachia endosymbiont of Ctenocephalides orientis wCori]